MTRTAFSHPPSRLPCFWRDFGFVLGALIAGIGADATSARTAILLVSLLTAASGLIVAATSWQPRAQLETLSTDRTATS